MQCRGVRAGGIGPNVAGARRPVPIDRGRRHQSRARALARKSGLTHFVNPKDVKGDIALTRGVDRGGATTAECIGNVDLMAGARVRHRGWGVSDHRRRRRRREIRTRPFQRSPVASGRERLRRRGRNDVPKSSLVHGGQINIDDLIPTSARSINRDSTYACGQIDPGSRDLLKAKVGRIYPSQFRLLRLRCVRFTMRDASDGAGNPAEDLKRGGN